MRYEWLPVACLFFAVLSAQAQVQDDPGNDPGLTGKISGLSNRLIKKVNDKVTGVNKALDRQTEKYLQKLIRQEARLKSKLSKFDSSAARNLFAGNAEEQYALKLQQLRTDTGAAARQRSPSGEYLPNVDSLQSSLSFLKQNPQLLDPTKINVASIQSSLDQLKVAQAKIQDADQLSQFIQQRKQQIQTYLSHYTNLPGGITNAFNGYKQQMFYYSQQVKEYKEMLNDPDKMMTKALQYLNRVPAFTSFVSKNSMLAGIFNLAGGPSLGGSGGGGGANGGAGGIGGGPGGMGTSGMAGTGGMGVGSGPGGTGAVIPGMPTRDQVMASFQQQSGVSGPNTQSIVQGNVSSAQDQTAQLQDKISSMGGNSAGGDLDMPDFKPNMQKTKSFLKRLEYGVNLQTVQGNYFFPATSDLAVSLGYKINDNNRVGIGASYKIGWGKDLQHIELSGQGASLRSFGDFKIKKNIFASGGFEYNYQQPIPSLAHIPSIRDWQQSALFGASRIVPMKGRVFKSMKMSLLWDALSYQQIPKAPPLKFRIGYSF